MRAVSGMILGLGWIGLVAGCEATAKSDRCERHWETTPSYEKIMAAPATQPSPIQARTWQAASATYAPPVVTHFGSYFEDPFVTLGDGNDSYGWTLMDLAAVVCSPARFVVNTVAVPVSMVKEPPCVLQCRDLDQPVEQCGLATRPAETQ